MAASGNRIFAGRFVLDVQVSEDHQATTWRAYDQALARWVNLLLLTRDDHRCEKLIAFTQQAAAIDSRGVVAILDVIEDDALVSVSNPNLSVQCVGIVTEWIEGQTLADYMLANDEVFPIEQALTICRALAMTFEQAHQTGIVHGHFTEKSVIFANSGETRIADFGVAKALHTHKDISNEQPGQLPTEDEVNGKQAIPFSVRDDIAALGRIFFRMLVGPWAHGQMGAMQEQAQKLSGSQTEKPNSVVANLLLPSQVRSGMPASVDRLYAATQNSDFTSMHEVVEALSVEIANLSPAKIQTAPSLKPSVNVGKSPKNPRITSKRRKAMLAFLPVLLLGWVGWQLMTYNFRSSGLPPALLPSNFAEDPYSSSSASPSTTLPSASPNTPSSTPSTTPSEDKTKLATITNVQDFDPMGNKTENPDLVTLAIDNDVTTAWQTVEYRDNTIAGKPGVGLLIDLGVATKIAAVSAQFTQSDQDVSIYLSSENEPKLTADELFAKKQSAGSSEVFTAKPAKSGRYLVIWLTRLPLVKPDTYQTGIVDIQVRLS